MPTLTTIIQHSTGSPSHSSQTKNEEGGGGGEKKGIKGNQIGKKDVKLLLCAGDIILYIDNPKEFTKTLQN